MFYAMFPVQIYFSSCYQVEQFPRGDTLLLRTFSDFIMFNLCDRNLLGIDGFGIFGGTSESKAGILLFFELVVNKVKSICRSGAERLQLWQFIQKFRKLGRI